MSKPSSNKGLSLPIAIGLVVLLMAASATINRLVIGTLQSIHQIEASNKAYMAAEAGVEDALYELSAHFAGYETPALNNANVRKEKMGAENPRWENNWSIASHNLSQNCAANICGSFNQKRKLNLALFNDQSADTPNLNGINENDASIQTMTLSNFDITIKVPREIILNDNVSAFSSGLIIDNDGDAWTTGDNINEDGEGDNGACGKDTDCDDREDEDSINDQVVYWKVSDGLTKSLTPKKGCLSDGEGAEICEKDFIRFGDDVTFTLNQNAIGLRENGTEQSIGDFLGEFSSANTNQLQMEFLVVAPLEQVDTFNQKKILIPNLNYEVNYSDGTGAIMPDPSYVIQSDGYYQDFKQSITTTLNPRTTSPLFDFTIIQQQ